MASLTSLLRETHSYCCQEQKTSAREGIDVSCAMLQVVEEKSRLQLARCSASYGSLLPLRAGATRMGFLLANGVNSPL